MNILKSSSSTPVTESSAPLHEPSDASLARLPVFITTTIPYVNAKPHIGHAQEFILTDTLARLFQSQGRSVTLQSGTDENAFKNVLAAQAIGLDTQTFVQQNSEAFQSLLHKLGVLPHSFIRTSSIEHRAGAELFWSKLKPEDLDERFYQGLYCTGCEDYWQVKDLVGGLCPDHRAAPQLIQERNLFFRLSRYQQTLENLIGSDTIQIYPRWRKNEVLSFIRRGLHDISLTRDASRSQNWGIRVPGRPDQVIYVWIEALVNYLTGQGYGRSEAWRDSWSERVHKVHVIGKNVWKFHAVYWPALLLSAGLPLPNDIVIHGFLTANGEKISKSLGNAIDPCELIDRYGTDALRHCLLHGSPIYQDADFSEPRLAALYNQDFANRLGNLVSRLNTLKQRGGLSFDPRPVRAGHADAADHFDYDVQGKSHWAWSEVDTINGEINQTKPWELLKKGNYELLQDLLRDWTDRLVSTAQILSSFVPQAAARVIDALQESSPQTERILFPKISAQEGQS